MQHCQEEPLVPPCPCGLCSADLTPGEGSVGFDGRCPAASSKFPVPWHSGCLITCSWWHLTALSCSSFSALSSRCSTCFSWQHTSKWHIPTTPSSAQPWTSLLSFQFSRCYLHSTPAWFSSSSTTEKQLNHLLVSLLNLTTVTLLDYRRPQLNSRGGVIIFFNMLHHSSQPKASLWVRGFVAQIQV